jgi:ribosomal protein RSM22 (predicted rRNA methylase)
VSGLPNSLHAALEQLGQGLDAASLRERAGTISGHYRARGASSGVVRSEADAYAYAVSRMPATYAALSMALAELQARAPDFAPEVMIDVGCGPGTALLAAAELYAVREGVLVDHNPAFLALAERLATETVAVPVRTMRVELRNWRPEVPADLVVCGYSLTELDDVAALRLLHKLWENTRGALVIAEPGRPADYHRLMTWRQALIGAGAEILAPCVHAAACPLPPDDWCHFSVRLERRKAHRAAKGAALGYEDEKVSYLIAARPGIGAPAHARVLRRPLQSKIEVQLSLCGRDGLSALNVPSRQRERYQAAKRLDWGDATVFGAGGASVEIAADEAAD